MRIRNQYLLHLLALMIRHGIQPVSAQLLGECWRDCKGRTDEEYFLHLHVLQDYGFIEIAEPDAAAAVSFTTLMQHLGATASPGNPTAGNRAGPEPGTLASPQQKPTAAPGTNRAGKRSSREHQKAPARNGNGERLAALARIDFTVRVTQAGCDFLERYG